MRMASVSRSRALSAASHRHRAHPVVVVVPPPPPPEPPNPPSPPPPKPPDPKPPVKQPEGPEGSMSRERALTVPEEAGAPTAATHAPLTRSEVEPVVVVETWALLGTVMLGVIPPVSWTATAVPLTAVTTPRTLAKSEANPPGVPRGRRSEEHTPELQRL